MMISVIMTGQYSDKSIYGVYTDKEMAEKIVEALYKTNDYQYGDARILEYKANSPALSDLMIRIRYIPDKNMLEWQEYDWEDIEIESRQFLEKYGNPNEERMYGKIFEFYIHYDPSFTDDILLKIAQDHWAAYKARQLQF